MGRGRRLIYPQKLESRQEKQTCLQILRTRKQVSAAREPRQTPKEQMGADKAGTLIRGQDPRVKS